MADRATLIKIGVSVDQNSVKVTSATMRQFFNEQNRQQRLTQKQALALQVAATKAEVKENEARTKSAQTTAAQKARLAAGTSKAEITAQTVITRETIKQTDLRRRAAEQETRTRQNEITKQKRDVDGRAKYEYQSGQKSLKDYITFLKAEESAETQSYSRRNRLIQTRQKLERGQTPSVSGTLARGAVAGVSAFGSAVAVKADLEMANNLANLASDLVEARDKNKRIFGEAAKDVDDWAKHADKTLGLSQTKALEAASTIGNLLHAGGITGKTGADLSIKLTQRAADIGSLNNLDPDVVADKIKSALSGSIRPLRELGIFISDDRIKAEALADSLVKPTKDAPKIKQAYEAVQISVAKLNEATAKYGKGSIEAAQASLSHEKAEGALSKAIAGHVGNLSDAVKIQARANIIFKDSALQAGNFAATSKEAANAQRIFNAELENSEIALGQKFLPLKKSVLAFLNDMLDKFNSLDDSTKNFATSTAAIGAVAIPLAAGVTNIVVQLLRIKAAYDAIKTAQNAAALSAALPTVAKVGARFAGPLIGAAESAGLAALLPFAAPVAVGAGLAYMAGSEGVQNSERNIANTGLPNRERIAFLRSQNAKIQSGIDKMQAGRSGGSSYASSIQGDDPLVIAEKKKQAVNEREITLLQNELLRETKNATARQIAAKKTESAAKAKSDAAAKDALNAGNPGASVGDLYSGAGRNAAARKAESEAAKQKKAAEKLDSDSDKGAQAFFLFVNQQAAKQKADTMRFLKETQDLWDKGSKAIAEANYTEAKNALETSDDPKRVKELAKIVRDRIMEIYNDQLSHLDAQFDRDIKPQAGESPMRRTAREGAVNARRNAGYDEANRTRDAELGQLDKQVKSAEGKVDEKRIQQAEKAIRSRDEFLAAEHRIIERQLRDADKTHDAEQSKALINRQMLNEIDTARRTFFEGFLSGDTAKISEGRAKFADAQDKAADALRDLAQKVSEQSAEFFQYYFGRDPAAQERADQADPTAKGRDRFFQQGGFTYDKKSDGGNRRVDGAAIDALAGLTDAAKQRGGDFFKALINGEGAKSALKDLGRNIGKDLGDKAGDFLQRKLLDGPLDKLFDSLADKLENALSTGGKEAGGNIAGAALLLSSAANIFGKNGKKKQRNTLLGGALGLGIASVLPGVGNLAGLGIGAALGGAFAGGGVPPIGRAVLVGEQGPELAMFSDRARIYSANDTAQMVRGGGMGGATTDARQINMKVDIGAIYDKPNADLVIGQLTDSLSAWNAFH